MDGRAPNILYIHSHDTGRYVSPHGYRVDTPNIRRLAEEGILFRRNFCINPTCSPSRAALLTGCYPHQNGMIGLAHRGFSLHDYGMHLVRPLQQAGYHCALSGTQHVCGSALAEARDRQTWEIIGYDRCLAGEPEAEKGAVRFLNDGPPQPFFLSVGFHETHRKYPTGDELTVDPRYCRPPEPVPDTPATRRDMAGFLTMAATLDRKMGEVFTALERNELADNALVICTTDHGIAFPRMKCNLHDSGTGVMLVVRGPGGFGGGKAADAMTTHMDIYPTLCALLGVERPEWLEGKSLLPLVRGEVDELHEAVFTQVNYHAAYEPMRAVRTERWKYIRRFDGRTRPVLPNCDPGPSKDVWLQHGWADREVEEEMLYDLVFDPNETSNIADHPECRDVLSEMRGRLERWMEQKDDPLLEGCVPAPAGVRVTDADAVSNSGPILPQDRLPGR